MKLTDTLILQATRQQVSNSLTNGAAILSLEDGIYYTVNEIGAMLWQLLSTPQTIQALREAVLAEYDVPLEIFEADLTLFVEKLMDAGLIEVIDG